MPTIKEVLDIFSDDNKYTDKRIEEMMGSPAAKGVNPGTERAYSSGKIQEEPYKVLSKAD